MHVRDFGRLKYPDVSLTGLVQPGCTIEVRPGPANFTTSLGHLAE